MVDDQRKSMRHLLAGLGGLDQRIGAGLARRMRGQPILRGSEGRILDLIGADGTRPSVLAEGAWISKQAIGKRIHDLEARGLVTLEPDPLDGRAVIVRRTAEGDRIRMFALEQIADLEREFADLVGVDRYDVFRSVLEELGTGPVSAHDTS
jgi:DNA-binding MarR family transcriptional regulator